MNEDPKFVWIFAYMVALHAEASRPRHESWSVPGGGGGVIRSAESDAATAEKAANLAVENFNKFQQQSEGK